jgi:hypothetical protein
MKLLKPESARALAEVLRHPVGTVTEFVDRVADMCCGLGATRSGALSTLDTVWRDTGGGDIRDRHAARIPAAHIASRGLALPRANPEGGFDGSNCRSPPTWRQEDDTHISELLPTSDEVE